VARRACGAAVIRPQCGLTGPGRLRTKSYLNAAAEQAAAPVIAEYTGRLAATDVFTTANAAALVNSTRIDAGILGPFGIHP
jgi:hypothetical protein